MWYWTNLSLFSGKERWKRFSALSMVPGWEFKWGTERVPNKSAYLRSGLFPKMCNFCSQFHLGGIKSIWSGNFLGHLKKLLGRWLYECCRFQSSIDLIRSSRLLCKGNLHLHKFAFSRKVIEAIPSSERPKDLVDLGLSLENLSVDRDLGMKWCLKSDQFHFYRVVQDQYVTRRAILSTVASVFDSLRLITWG